MGIGPAIFSSAGQRSEHYVPGAYSRSLAVGGEGTGVSANNGVILGKSRGGQPNRLFVFSSVQEARETLVDGELLKAVAHAFNPSSEYSPQAIRAMVVNGNTQAEATLQANNQDVMKLKTSSWGLTANSFTYRVVEGTDIGTKKIIFTASSLEESIDNIGKKSIQVEYIGSASIASLMIDNSGITINLDGQIKTLLFDNFPTIEEVVKKLNSEDFIAIQLENETNVPSNELDAVSNIDLKSGPVVLKSDYYAFYRALETSPWIGKGNISKPVGALNIIPDNNDDPVYFEGASEGTFTVDDWNVSLGVLETEDIQIISSHVTDKIVQILISNHCTAMSNVQNRKERTAILGGGIGETIDDAIDFAKQLNNKLVSYCYPAITAFSPLTGETENLPASYFACKLLGMECTVAVNEPLTWKNVSVFKFYKKLKISEMEKLIRGGVLCGGTTDDNRLAVIRAMTTHQGNQLQLVERSMVREDLYMNRDLRNIYSRSVGRPGSGKASEATMKQILFDAARAWRGEGLIVPTDGGENVWGIVVRVVGDKNYITFNRNLTAPQNFFFVTAYNYVYESAVTVEV